jgi:hypothetical protein
MLMHVIQMFQYRLFMRCPICFVKLLKIWLDILHVYVYVKHEIIPLLVDDIMCTTSTKTFTLLLKN